MALKKVHVSVLLISKELIFQLHPMWLLRVLRIIHLAEEHFFGAQVQNFKRPVFLGDWQRRPLTCIGPALLNREGMLFRLGRYLGKRRTAQKDGDKQTLRFRHGRHTVVGIVKDIVASRQAKDTAPIGRTCYRPQSHVLLSRFLRLPFKTRFFCARSRGFAFLFCIAEHARGYHGARAAPKRRHVLKNPVPASYFSLLIACIAARCR